MKTIRIGVIGVGIMGERHCRVCANLPQVQLIGVADANEDRGRVVADRHDTLYFGDHTALLSQVDAVIIATPTPAHYALAVQALEQGIHTLVEKPITDTVQQAQRIVDLANQRNLVLQVGHIERFNPAFTELQHVTQSMEIIGMNVRRLSSFDSSNTDVDVIRDLMIHDLDLVASAIPADIQEISAWGCCINSHSTDHAVATISFENGAIATLAASRVTEHKVRSIEVTARGAYVEADLLNKSVLIRRHTLPRYLETSNATEYRQESIIEQIYVPAAEPLLLELRHFTDCVRENRPSRVPGNHGLRALQLADIISFKVNTSLSSQGEIEQKLSELVAWHGVGLGDQEAQ